MKTERTQIHFLSDVLVAVASLDLKVPIATSKVAVMKTGKKGCFCGPKVLIRDDD